MFKLDTKIMVVDDMMTMRKIVIKALKEMGYTILTEAGDGELAWPLLRAAGQKNEAYGLIISDWNMPKMKGIDLLRHVRAEPQLSATPFVLLTAESEVGQIQEAVKAGVDQYVIKPFSAEVLKEKLELVHKKKDAA